MSDQAARVRRVAAGPAALVALLVVTQFVLPGTGSGRGTPAAILFRGAVLGIVSALTATGIVLVHRTLRIVNFSQTALGVAGGLLAFRLIQYTAVPFPIALLLGLALAGLVGLGVGLLTLRFSRSPRLVLTVLTIVAADLLTDTRDLVDRLPFFPSADARGADAVVAEGAFRSLVPFAAFEFRVGGLPIDFGFAEILAVELSVIALIGVSAFFRFTRAGVAVRAVSENAERAQLLGIGTAKLSCLVWGLAGVLSGTAVILTGVLETPAAAIQQANAVLLLPALAAAVLGRMRSLPVTVFAAVLLSIASEAWAWSVTEGQGVFRVGLFLVIGIGLLAQRRELVRSEQDVETSSWGATKEQRPVPQHLLAVPGVRLARRALVVLALVLVGVYPFVVGIAATNLGGVVALNAIVVVSLVVLTGWAGQVSLGQFAFAALGAVLGGALTARVGIPFWFAVPITTLLVAAFAALVGLPALRIRGLFLLVVTFAFAVAVEATLFDERWFGWLLPERIDRPSLLLLDFEDERSMYYLCVGALVLVVALVGALRRTRVARILIGARENEAAVRAFGVGAVRAKLLAFAISGGMAGFAGALLAHQQRGLSVGTFAATASVDVFIQAVFGGIGAVGGAVIGSLYFNAVAYASGSPIVLALVGPFTTLVLLYVAPGGVISLVRAVRDAALAVVAQRRGLALLPTDGVDGRAAVRITPLAPHPGQGGLAAMPADRRFALDSELYDIAPPPEETPSAIDAEIGAR